MTRPIRTYERSLRARATTSVRVEPYDPDDEVVRSYVNFRGEVVEVTRAQSERTEAARLGLAALGLEE